MSEFFNVKLVLKPEATDAQLEHLRELIAGNAEVYAEGDDDGDGVIHIQQAYDEDLEIDDIVEDGFAHLFEDTEPMEAIGEENHFFWRIQAGQVQRCGGMIVPDKAWVVGGPNDFQPAVPTIHYHHVECDCDLCTYDGTLIEHPGEY